MGAVPRERMSACLPLYSESWLSCCGIVRIGLDPRRVFKDGHTSGSVSTSPSGREVRGRDQEVCGRDQEVRGLDQAVNRLRASFANKKQQSVAPQLRDDGTLLTRHGQLRQPQWARKGRHASGVQRELGNTKLSHYHEDAQVAAGQLHRTVGTFTSQMSQCSTSQMSQ